MSAFCGSSDQKASKTLRVATVAASGSVPPVMRLRQCHDVGNDSGLLAGEHVARAAEAGENFVEDQQKLMFVGECSQPLEHGDIVKFHAAGTLHQRLDNDAGKFIRIPSENTIERSMTSSCRRRATGC